MASSSIGFQLYFHLCYPNPISFPLMSIYWVQSHFGTTIPWRFRPKPGVKTSRLFWEFGWLTKGLSSTQIPIPRSNLRVVDCMHIYKPTKWSLVKLDDIFSVFLKLKMASALTNVCFVIFPQREVCRHWRINTNCKRDTKLRTRLVGFTVIFKMQVAFFSPINPTIECLLTFHHSTYFASLCSIYN